MFGILIAIIALAVYGSLYPWHFAAKVLPESPLWLLFHSWDAGSGRRFVADTTVNIALYQPLGMAGFLALRNALRWASIEEVQISMPGRTAEITDPLLALPAALGLRAMMRIHD